MRFTCTNKSCENKEVIIPKVKFIWNKEKKKLMPSETFYCKLCSSPLEEVIKEKTLSDLQTIRVSDWHRIRVKPGANQSKGTYY